MDIVFIVSARDAHGPTFPMVPVPWEHDLHIGHTNAAASGCEIYRDLGRLKCTRMRGACLLLPQLDVCASHLSVTKCTCRVPWNGVPSGLHPFQTRFHFRTFRYAP